MPFDHIVWNRLKNWPCVYPVVPISASIQSGSIAHYVPVRSFAFNPFEEDPIVGNCSQEKIETLCSIRQFIDREARFHHLSLPCHSQELCQESGVPPRSSAVANTLHAAFFGARNDVVWR